MKLCFLVVLYNMKLQESNACISLLDQTDSSFSVIVYDNSEIPTVKDAECAASGWQLLGGAGNAGLSKAYNEALDTLFASGFKGRLCLLDGDTALPDTFAADILAMGDCEGITVPLICENGRLISPWRDTLSRSRRYYSTPEECLASGTDEMLAFNSGMTVPMTVYEHIRYDERIFLDGADISFLRSARKAGVPLTVIPAVCSHSFSANARPAADKAFTRFGIYCADTRVLYEDRPGRFLLYAGKRALKLCAVYKTAEPLRILFKGRKE